MDLGFELYPMGGEIYYAFKIKYKLEIFYKKVLIFIFLLIRKKILAGKSKRLFKISANETNKLYTK